MKRLLGALVLGIACSFVGAPALMARDNDNDTAHPRRHHRHHRHHHCRHHKHHKPNASGTPSTTKPS